VATISRRDGVMNEIRRAIILGALKPGEKLTENRLSTALNVSRPTMREALAQLSQEGLLVQEPYRGLRVADLDAGAIMDIARTRVALDMLAVEGILADPTDRRLDLVRQAWEEYDRLPFDADPVEGARGTRRVPPPDLGGVGKHPADPAVAGHRCTPDHRAGPGPGHSRRPAARA
jgi:DNA-binding GntR family transcriptional regulator